MKRSVLDDQDYFDSLKFVAAKNRKDLQQRVVRSLPLASSNSRLNRCALPHTDGTKRDEEYLLSVNYRHHASAAITNTNNHTASVHDGDAQRNFTPLTLLRRVVDVLQSFESIRWDYVAFPTKRDSHHLFPKDPLDKEEEGDSSSSSDSTTEENIHAKQLAQGIAQAKVDFADAADLTADDLALLGTLASGDTEFLASIHGYSSTLPGGHAGGGGCEVGTAGLELPRPDTALLTHGRITGAASSQHISQSINHHNESSRLNASSILRVGVNDTAIDIFTRLVQTECASVLVLLELYSALTEFDRRIRGAILARRGALNKLKRRADRERVSISTMDQIGSVLKNVAKNAKSAKSTEAAMIENALRGGAVDGSSEEEDDVLLSDNTLLNSTLNSSGALSSSYGSEGDNGGADSLNGSAAERDQQRDRKRDQRRHVRESKARSKVRKAQRKKVVNHLLKQEELAKATLKGASQEVRDRAGSAANQEAATAAATAHEHQNGESSTGGASLGVDKGSLRRKSSTIAERRAKMIEASQKEKKRLAEYNSIKKKRTEIQIHVEYLDVADELVDSLQQAYLSITSSAIALNSATSSHRSASFANSSTSTESSSLLRANSPLLMVRLFDLQLSASDGSPNRCFPSLLPPVTPFYFPRYKLDELQQLMRMQDDDDGLLMDATTTSQRSPRSGKSDPCVVAYVPPRHTITHAEAYCREFVEESIHELNVDLRRVDHQRRTLEMLGLSSADQMVKAFTNKREQLLWDVGQREDELDKQRRRLGIRAQMGKMSNADAQFEIAAITEEIDRMYKVVPSGLSDEELQLMYTAPASPFQHAAAARIRSSALAAQLQSGGVDADGDVSNHKSKDVDESAEPFSRGLLIPTNVPKHVFSFSDEDGGMESDAACVAESIKGYYLTPLHLRRLQVSSVSLFSPSEVLLSYAHQLKRDLHTSSEAKSNQHNRQRNAALFGPYAQSGGGGANAGNSPPVNDDVRGARNNSYKFPMAVTVTLQDTLRTFLSTTLIPELLLRLEGDFKHYCASYKVLETVASSAATVLPLSVNLKNLEKRMETFKSVSSSGAIKSSRSPHREGGGVSGQGSGGGGGPHSPGDAGTTALGGTFAALDKEFDDAIAAVASELDKAKEKKLRCAELEVKRKATERDIDERRQRDEREARERAATRESERQRLKAEDDKKRQLQEKCRQDARDSELEAKRSQQKILSLPIEEARRKLEGRLSEKVRAQVATSAAYPSLEVQMRMEGSPGSRRVARRTEPTYETTTPVISSEDGEDTCAPQTLSQRKALLVEDSQRNDALNRQEDFNLPRNNLTRALNQKGLEAKFLGPLFTASGKPINPLSSANARTQPSAELVDIVDNIDRKMSHEREYSDKTMQRKRRELEDRLADKFHDGVLQQHEATKHDKRSETRRVQKDVMSQRTERQNILEMYTKAGFDDTTASARSVQSAPSPGRKKPSAKLPMSREGWGSHGDSADVLTMVRQNQSRQELDSNQLSSRLRGVPPPSDIERHPHDCSEATMKPVKDGAKYAHFSRSSASSDKLLSLALSSLGFDDESKEFSLLQRQIDVANNPHNPLRTHHENLTPAQKSEIETLRIPSSKPISIVDVYALGRNDNMKPITASSSSDIDIIQRSRVAKVAEVTAPAIHAASHQRHAKVRWGDEEEKACDPTVFERLSILQNNDFIDDAPTEQEVPQPQFASSTRSQEPPMKVIQNPNLQKARAQISSAQREIGHVGFVSVDTPVAQ